MNDRRVKSLIYKIVGPPGVWYDAPLPLTWETDICEFRLERGEVNVRLKRHYERTADARKEVETLLRAWEISSGLKIARAVIAFSFVRSEIADHRDDAGEASSRSQGVVNPTTDAFVVLVRRNYPSPPVDFAVTPEIEVLWARYAGYKEGREVLTSMAYFCLTVLEKSTGSRPELARAYNIDPKVLAMLGKLTALGDAKTARKLSSEKFLSLTPVQSEWIEAAVRLIIERAGVLAVGSGRRSKQITMTDLPPL